MQKQVRTTGRSNSATRSSHSSFVAECTSNAIRANLPVQETTAGGPAMWGHSLRFVLDRGLHVEVQVEHVVRIPGRLELRNPVIVGTVRGAGGLAEIVLAEIVDVATVGEERLEVRVRLS